MKPTKVRGRICPRTQERDERLTGRIATIVNVGPQDAPADRAESLVDVDSSKPTSVSSTQTQTITGGRGRDPYERSGANGAGLLVGGLGQRGP
jgi:hypothetical protein